MLAPLWPFPFSTRSDSTRSFAAYVPRNLKHRHALYSLRPWKNAREQKGLGCLFAEHEPECVVVDGWALLRRLAGHGERRRALSAGLVPLSLVDRFVACVAADLSAWRAAAAAAQKPPPTYVVCSRPTKRWLPVPCCVWARVRARLLLADTADAALTFHDGCVGDVVTELEGKRVVVRSSSPDTTCASLLAGEVVCCQAPHAHVTMSSMLFVATRVTCVAALADTPAAWPC